MNSFIVTFILFACIPSLHPQVPDNLKYKNLDCSEFGSACKAAKIAVLIDIRDYADFRKSRIKGAVNIPRSGGYDIAADTIDKGKALFIYCYSGVSSKKAAVYFYDKGFREIYSLKGGMIRWKSERKALDRKKLKKNSKLATMVFPSCIMPPCPPKGGLIQISGIILKAGISPPLGGLGGRFR